MSGHPDEGIDDFDPPKDPRPPRGTHDTAEALTRAYVLHPAVKTDRKRRLPEHGLAEAVSLAAALPGLDVIGAQIVRLSKVAPGLLFGTGKVEEIKTLLKEEKIDLDIQVLV